MSTPARPFRPGPGTLIFIGIIVLLVADKNSRNVLKLIKERTKAQVERIQENFDGLQSSLDKGRPSATPPEQD